MNRPLLRVAFCVVIALGLIPLPSFSSGSAPDALLVTLQHELKRATTSLASKTPSPYSLSYSVADIDNSTIYASNGSLILSTAGRRRQADVMMRVGSPALDNTHNQSRPSGIVSGVLPLSNDQDAIARVLWQLTNREYEQASSALVRVQSNQAVQSEEEDKSPDFSSEKPQSHLDESQIHLSWSQKAWEERLRRITAVFLQYPDIYTSGATLNVSDTRSYLVNNEGTALVQPSAVSRLVIDGQSRSDDGMDVMRIETFQAATPDQLPSEAELIAKATKIAQDVEALRVAPEAEPYAGPALLSGRAAAVFFHEVLGHRLEGHRQRDESQGQTFTKKVNQLVLPAFLSVTDDPTLTKLNGIPLAGYYAYDDEGVPAQKVIAVENGVLKNFLLSRMPIANFSASNGHGRRQPGLMPTGRQGNLIVTSTNTVSDAELRKRFIEEIKKQNKPYGLYFEDIEGGFTLTGRAQPQAFQVIPIMVWRVYPDGRPDQLVRGVDIVGTPLLALNNIILTGNKQEVFNGICGAESGQVPVSAVAPEMLFSEIEVQKRAKGTQRPPLLPPPDLQNAARPGQKNDGL